MSLPKGTIVSSRAGHDAAGLFCVLDTQEDGFVLVADGKTRKTARPKRKNVKHLTPVDAPQQPVFRRIAAGEPAQDSELRRALAAVRDELQSRRV